MTGHWTLEDIPWDEFDPAKVDADILKVIKAAAMVEANGRDYGTYLCNVFHDDPEFQAVARAWAAEETQHGAALARWARLADPDFDFDESFKRFTDGYRLPLEAARSVRGSRAGELVARCIVETGTSSYYTALGDAAEEPVLRAICRHIAADEFRHYKLFYDHLRRYVADERPNLWQRLRVVLARLVETGADDELPFAYHCANESAAGYDRRRSARAYSCRAYRYYAPPHIDRAVAMMLKAIGYRGNGRIGVLLSRAAYRLLRFQVDRLSRAGA